MRRSVENIREYLKRDAQLALDLEKIYKKDGDEKTAALYMERFSTLFSLYCMLETPEKFGEYAEILDMK